MALVYTFDLQSNSWSIPKITGIANTRKKGLTGIIDNHGNIYLWGGCFRPDNIGDCLFANDMLILDTINLSWKKGSFINAPISRAYHGATLLPNNNIIYMGGFDDITLNYDHKTLNINQGNSLALSEIYIYDTINDNWHTNITSGKIPSNRACFSSILGLDGQKIIIFGGTFVNPGYSDTTLYVLDLTNFNWYIPNISGKIPSPRIFHKANVIGKYMVISFGFGYDKFIESDILLLDISNNEEYIWTTTFIPSLTPPSSSSSPSSSSPSPSSPSSLSQPFNNNSSNNTPAMAGAIVGSLFGGILLSFGVFFLYKWNKNKQKQKDILQIESYNNNNQEGIPTSTERDIHNNGQKSMLTTLRNFDTNITSRNEAMKIPTPIINNRNNNYGQEIVQISRDENTTNHEPISPIGNRNNNYGQEIIQIPRGESTTDHEPITPISNRNNNYGQEIIQIPRDENTINYEPITPAPVVNRNYNQGQEDIPTSNNDRLSLQIFKDEILQAVKQEISQNLKNEILQAVKENSRNNGRQD
ncbi:hypothetical protein C1645_877589 [Glomus cerebriforme]|uniref:Galactose oxidase n=1 Tax=Glomus cerebriforme TaxID=658196 RepID=A0A397SPR4_9GLOM|nr:hypothetical protein C1645_877589 [Glomus cerebriforme]